MPVFRYRIQKGQYGMGDTLQILTAMIIYMAAVIIIGVTFARKANASSDAYFLGGRSLGPWVTAMSAEASDMSGWLLMGLPGVAYWCGIADAAWTAIGLAAGTYINWLIVSKRLRRYSEKAGNAITLPEYFSNRFHEKKKSYYDDRGSVYPDLLHGLCGKLSCDLWQALLYIVWSAIYSDDDRGGGVRTDLYDHRWFSRGERFGLYAGHCDDRCTGSDRVCRNICGRRSWSSDRQCERYTGIP